MSTPKWFHNREQLLAACRGWGFEVRKTANGHWQVVWKREGMGPNRVVAVFPGTNTLGNRIAKNQIAQIKRFTGIDVRNDPPHVKREPKSYPDPVPQPMFHVERATAPAQVPQNFDLYSLKGVIKDALKELLAELFAPKPEPKPEPAPEPAPPPEPEHVWPPPAPPAPPESEPAPPEKKKRRRETATKLAHASGLLDSRGRRGVRAISDETANQWLDAYLKGKSQGQIAKETGLTQSTVSRWVRIAAKQRGVFATLPPKGFKASR